MRVSLPSFLAGATAAVVLVAIPATAVVVTTAAADPHPTTYDGTSPALTLAPVEFIIGSSIDAAQPLNTDMCSTWPWNGNVPLRMRWSGSDATSGLTGFDVWGVGPKWDGYAHLADDTTATTYDYSGSNYYGDCGQGGEFANQYWVTDRDNKGNTAASSVASQHVRVWDENGANPSEGEVTLGVTRTGTWSTASCTCFNNGKTSYSTAKNASVTYKVTATNIGQTFGVVMEKANNRGTVNISVDGGTAVAVSTNATTTAHRVVVWQRQLTVGVHTVKLTNAGTTGHGRIDVDSLMMTNGPTGESAPEPQVN